MKFFGLSAYVPCSQKNVITVLIVPKQKRLLDVVIAFCSVEDLGSLFEKRDFKDKRRTTGTKSTLSMRLEQCPQQLNNPFNEYSKFDGKVNFFHILLLFYSLFVCLWFLFSCHFFNR